jgi:hypothetical protein
VNAAVFLAAEKPVRRAQAFAFGHMDAANVASPYMLGRSRLGRAAAEPEAPARPPAAARAALGRLAAPPEQDAEQAAQYEPQHAEADEDENEEKKQDQFEHADPRRRTVDKERRESIITAMPVAVP